MLETHKHLVDICNSTYLDDLEAFKKVTQEPNTEALFGESLHKYVIEKENHYIIAFRGSVNKTDWLHDFNIISTEWVIDRPGTNELKVNVHSGVFKGLQSLINPPITYNKPLIITGHSLGGGYATLEAFRLAALGNKIEQVVLFGPVKVGAKSFTEAWENTFHLKTKTTIYRNRDDIVNQLPPRYYRTPGTFIQLGPTTSWFNPMHYYNMIHYHHIEHYVEAIHSLHSLEANKQ